MRHDNLLYACRTAAKHIAITMNIGFDAKRAYHNGTGLGNYSRSLVQSLATFFPRHQYLAFNPKPSTRFSLPALPNITEVQPQTALSKALPPLWRSRWMTADLQRLHIDIYHGLSNELPAGIRRTGAKSVVTIHDLIFERYPKQYNPIDVRIYRQKYKYACRVANRVIAISQQTKADLVQFYGVPPEKIDVCYQSCNPLFEKEATREEKEAVRRRYGLPQRYFLSVGSLIERKNLLTVCKAMQLLKGKTDIPLVVVGDGRDYKKKIKHFLADGGLTDRVIFLNEREAVRNDPDFRSNRSFPALYQMAEALVYPSFFEGFGIPVLEGLWSRIPVITSNTSCLPEAGGPCAYYVYPDQPQQIAQAFLDILADREKVAKNVALGWQYAQQFTPQATATQVMQVYQRLQ